MIEALIYIWSISIILFWVVRLLHFGLEIELMDWVMGTVFAPIGAFVLLDIVIRYNFMNENELIKEQERLEKILERLNDKT